jgi:outer membrane protein
MNRTRALWIILICGSIVPLGLRAQNTRPDQPLSLPEAVQLALRNNPTIKASVAYTEAVRQGITVAKSARYPHLDFSEGFTRSNNPVYVFGTLLTQRQFAPGDFALNTLNTPLPLNNFQTQFTGAMPLYDAGQTSGMVRDARLTSRIARNQHTRTEQQVIFDVVSAYTNELLAREGLRVAQSALKAAQSDLKNAQVRQEQGMAVPSDLLSAQVQLASAQQDLLSAQNGVALAHASLNVAVGLPENAPTHIEGRLSETQFDAGTLEERQRRAMVMRPDYLAARLERQRAENGTRMARARLQPTLSLFSSWALDNQTFATRGGNNWAAGATLTFNVFDGGAKFARITEAQARARQADALQAQLNAAIRLQVEEAFLNLATARQRVQVARGAVSEAKESLRILQNRYEAGLATMTSVLQAEAARTNAEKNYLNAVYDYRLSYAALELATGELSPDSPAVLK